jgi:hypothetical protein
MTVVVTAVLMLMAGLGVDVGYLRYQRQQMQKAADAGAIAGASALIYGGDYINAARNDSSANGFTQGTNNVTVAVYNPPQTPGDPFTGDSRFVEVIVSQPQPTFFMKVGGFFSVAVRARAIASAARSSSACIYALDPVDPDSFKVTGTAAINSACGIKVNSSDEEAFDKTGSGDITVAKGGIGIVGNINEVGSGAISPDPTTGIAPFSDPLAGVPEPTVGGCDHPKQTRITGTTPASLSPGVYCDGIKITGSGTVNFASGTYILLGGGIDITGSPTLVGNGVTFYNTADASHSYAPMTITGSAGTTLSAPTTGALAGILFFQDRSLNVCCGPTTVNSFDGSNGEVYTGALYFPTTPVKYTGSTSLSAYSIIVGWQIEMVGSSTLNDDYSSLPNGASPIHTAGLAE